VGYDHHTNGNKLGKHWFGAHPNPIEKISAYDRWIHQKWNTVPESAVELGVEIVNCTPKSAIKCFREGKLEKELAE
jgi:hypothetical protein